MCLGAILVAIGKQFGSARTLRANFGYVSMFRTGLALDACRTRQRMFFCFNYFIDTVAHVN